LSKHDNENQRGFEREEAQAFLSDLETFDSSFTIDKIPTDRLNNGIDRVDTVSDVCVMCDAPKDVCKTCDTIDCVICDAPNDVECPKPASDKCQWCTMRDPGAPADAG